VTKLHPSTKRYFLQWLLLFTLSERYQDFQSSYDLTRAQEFSSKKRKKVFIAQIELTWDPENQEPERQTISTRERQTRVNKKRRICLHSKQFAQDVIKARFIIVFHVRIFEQVVFVLFFVQLVEQERQQQQQQRKRKRRERRQRQDVERSDGENGQAGHRDRLSEKVNKQNNYKQKNTTDSASFLPSSHYTTY